MITSGFPTRNETFSLKFEDFEVVVAKLTWGSQAKLEADRRAAEEEEVRTCRCGDVGTTRQAGQTRSRASSRRGRGGGKQTCCDCKKPFLLKTQASNDFLQARQAEARRRAAEEDLQRTVLLSCLTCFLWGLSLVIRLDS